jgi:predicted nucleic acid-binding protein
MFFDTNIFIYLYADTEYEKQEISRRIINEAQECITSTQILNEINNVIIKKWGMPYGIVKAIQSDVQRIGELVYITEKIVDKAIDLHFCYGFAYYDCLMIASALDSECDILYTEDMNNGQIIDGRLRIVNPFAEN